MHVNRVLKDLRKQGLIALQGKFLKVLDWEGLQAAGEFDPTYLHLVKKRGALTASEAFTGPSHKGFIERRIPYCALCEITRLYARVRRQDPRMGVE